MLASAPHDRADPRSKKCKDTHSTWLILQAFNKGLFDFLIATDDPSKERTEKPGLPPTDSSNAAVVSQQPGAAGEAAEEATGTPGAENDVEDAAPDHAWTEAAAATAKSSEVNTDKGFQTLTSGFMHWHCVVWAPCFGPWACNFPREHESCLDHQRRELRADMDDIRTTRAWLWPAI